MQGFVANASFGVPGSSPYAPHYGVDSGISTAFVFENDGTVVFSDLVDHVPFTPASRVTAVLGDTPCVLQAKLVAQLVSDFDSLLSRSDGNTIQWIFV